MILTNQHRLLRHKCVLWGLQADQGGNLPELLSAIPRDGSSGELLKVYDKAVVEICMAPLCFEHTCTISDKLMRYWLVETFCYVIILVLQTYLALKRN